MEASWLRVDDRLVANWEAQTSHPMIHIQAAAVAAQLAAAVSGFRAFRMETIAYKY